MATTSLLPPLTTTAFAQSSDPSLPAVVVNPPHPRTGKRRPRPAAAAQPPASSGTTATPPAPQVSAAGFDTIEPPGLAALEPCRRIGASDRLLMETFTDAFSSVELSVRKPSSRAAAFSLPKLWSLGDKLNYVPGDRSCTQFRSI